MAITGEMLIGGSAVRGSGSAFRAHNPATLQDIEPSFAGGSLADVDRACRLAGDAFDIYRAIDRDRRAAFLETIADRIEALGDVLVERCMAESGLPRARVEGERARTANQLRLFAKVVREGAFLGLRVDPALPDRQPAPRPDLRLRMIALGPVAVFGAANFPLAFSVAGGDTASALAAGCPVVVKAHPAHPGTSELVGRAIVEAASQCGMPEGVFALLFDQGHEIGGALVADPRIKAVGFTGSRAGGEALMRIAQARPEPIPVYAEMSSINPVILFDGALAERAERIADGFVTALLMGAGQFCTSPGLVIAREGAGLDRFVAGARERLRVAEAAVMLTPAIHHAYRRGVEVLERTSGVDILSRGSEASGCRCQAALFAVGVDVFLAEPALREEVFGAASLIVRCRDTADVARVIERLDGQLTISMHLADADHAEAAHLLPLLERKAGRIIANGFGTGVEVANAMVHGGPYPASSDSRSTSVGSLAIERFLHPVCYQDLPPSLLPVDLVEPDRRGAGL